VLGMLATRGLKGERKRLQSAHGSDAKPDRGTGESWAGDPMSESFGAGASLIAVARARIAALVERSSGTVAAAGILACTGRRIRQVPSIPFDFVPGVELQVPSDIPRTCLQLDLEAREYCPQPF